MCSRESCSVVPSRLLAGLLIFLGAFLVGLATAKFAFLPERPIVTTFQSAIEEQKGLNSCENADSVVLRIRNDVARENNLSRPYLEIANDSPHPIYFFPYDLWVRGKSMPFEYPAAAQHRSAAFQEIEIPSGTTAYLPLRSPTPAEAIFRYRIGEARSFRSFTVHFDDACR